MNKIYNAAVPISSEQWSFVLANKKITKPSTLKLLRYLLKCPKYTERAGIIA
jgi:hypothetical protein